MWQDCVTRYAHMNGFHVERKWGWDCHGLPVEYEIDQKLGIKCRDDVLKMTVKAYNAECRGVVRSAPPSLMRQRILCTYTHI